MIRKMDKKGSMWGWVETISLTMLFVVLFGIIIGDFNTSFGESHSIGLDTSDILENGSLSQYTVNAQGQINTGETEEVDSGLSLKSSWTVAKGVWAVTWSVISGAWIPTIISMLMLPSIIGTVLQTIFLTSLVFAVIKLFFKVLV